MTFHRIAAVSALALAYACSPSSGGGTDKPGSLTGKGTGGTGAGASGNGDGSGSTGNGTGNEPGGIIGGGFDQDGGGTKQDTDATCAGLVLKPETITVEKEIPIDIDCTAETPQPINIYLVLDNSGSMKDNNKWNDAVAAITEFVKSDPTLPGKAWTCTDKDGKDVVPPADLPPPGAGSISVAIQYFHPKNVGTNPNECDGVAHSTPAVAMAPIPGVSQAIVDSLKSTGPTSDTPTVGSLKGGVKYCGDFEAASPDKKCVVVLVTDGQPNGCGLSSQCPNSNSKDCVDPSSESTLSPIVSGAFADPAHPVITFTVGMNGVNAAGFALLDKLAIAGGSDCSPNTPGAETCNVTSGGSQGFLDALNTIRKTVQVTTQSSQSITVTTTETSTLQCEWAIPQPSDGQTFHKELVNVSYTVTDAQTKLGNVTDQTACDAAGGGWYYDDNDAPTRIVTCPDTCTAIKASVDTKVNVVVGCATEPARPR